MRSSNNISIRRQPFPFLWLFVPLWLLIAHPGYADEAELGGTIEAQANGRLFQLPSLSSAIEVDLQGDLARVRVTQTFENPFAEPMHARYLFPLNTQAAVHALTMTVGTERVRAVIQKKAQAEATFQAAKAEGKAAALLTQHRPNMFTQKIANLMPGLPITVELEYTQTVPKVDHAYELVLPLVVGPRFNPAAPPNQTQLQQSLSALPTPPPVAGIDVPATIETDRVSVQVALDSSIGLNEISSRTHAVDVQRLSGNRAEISLADGANIANRDFVLRYVLGAATSVSTGLLAHTDQRGGFFSLMIEPPMVVEEANVLPREMVFLLDCSGSMGGAPLQASKAFMHSALQALRPQDRFRIIRFSDHATEFSRQPLSATPDNVAAGIRYTEALEGSGGTVMRSGVEQALMVPQPAGYVRNVIFLTDGYIGNEFEILGLVKRELGAARLFALGVGSGVNRFLLDELARAGRGFARYLDATQDVVAQADALAQRLHTPLLTDVRVDWGDLAPFGITPTQIPDLYAGDSVRLQGRYVQGGVYDIRVQGRSGGEAVTLPLRLTLDEPGTQSGQPDGDAIALIWARSQIKDAMQQLSVPQQLRIEERSDESIAQRVTALGLQFSLATRWTSFVAVSEEVYNPNPELAGERDVAQAQVAGVGAQAYPAPAQAHGGYAAPEPSTYLGLALLVLLGLLWVGFPTASRSKAAAGLRDVTHSV